MLLDTASTILINPNGSEENMDDRRNPNHPQHRELMLSCCPHSPEMPDVPVPESNNRPSFQELMRETFGTFDAKFRCFSHDTIHEWPCVLQIGKIHALLREMSN